MGSAAVAGLVAGGCFDLGAAGSAAATVAPVVSVHLDMPYVSVHGAAPYRPPVRSADDAGLSEPREFA